MNLVVNLDLANLTRFEQAVALFGQNKPRQWAAWALNQVGRKMRTQIIRSLVQQTGLKYGEVLGEMSEELATDWNLRYYLEGSGRYFGVGHFRPYQTRRAIGPMPAGGGVVASPWNKPRLFRHAFLSGGRVFVRRGPERLPIKFLYGPSIPREMERDQVPKDFEEAAERELPAAVERKLAQMLPW